MCSISPNRQTAQYDQLCKEELVKLVVEQKKQLEQQQTLIENLSQEIERLKVSRELDSNNSSKPPSSDLLKKSQKKPEAGSEAETPNKRKPGGQPGHQGKTRKGFGRIDRYEMLRPQNCRACGGTLVESPSIQIETLQVAQLVERPIEIVEYQRHRCQCAKCGTLTDPAWPSSIVPGQDLGVRLQALLGWLGNYGHLPYEKQQEMLWELGRIDIGVGTLVKTQQRLERAIQPSVEALRTWVNQEQPNLHVDETPWAVKGVKEWLWVLSHPQLCLFHAGDSRSREELVKQLGSSYQGVLITDDYSVYNGYPVKAQQKCLAHLRRHFLGLIKQPGQHNPSIGEAFVALIDEAFRRYRLWQENGDPTQYQQWAREFKIRIQTTLDTWSAVAGAHAGKLLRSLKQKAAQWWYFLDYPQVPPDNNLAERALRLAVTKRKVSGGSRSLERFEQTANLLTVVQSCRFQKRSLIDFFENTLVAAVAATEPPSLIPSLHT
jgi:transposase